MIRVNEKDGEKIFIKFKFIQKQSQSKDVIYKLNLIKYIVNYLLISF